MFVEGDGGKTFRSQRKWKNIMVCVRRFTTRRLRQRSRAHMVEGRQLPSRTNLRSCTVRSTLCAQERLEGKYKARDRKDKRAGSHGLLSEYEVLRQALQEQVFF